MDTDDRPPHPLAATVSPAAGNELPYTSPGAFRAALKARFTVIAKQDPRYTVNCSGVVWNASPSHSTASLPAAPVITRSMRRPLVST